ncbi:MAG: hypothetical protein LBR11_06690 [Deltaproteobacteria bacterium]|nr:hypothetical protein [Deltaproteobacteria bacterium]
MNSQTGPQAPQRAWPRPSAFFLMIPSLGLASGQSSDPSGPALALTPAKLWKIIRPA